MTAADGALGGAASWPDSSDDSCSQYWCFSLGDALYVGGTWNPAGDSAEHGLLVKLVP